MNVEAKLNELAADGTIQSFDLVNLDENGQIGESKNRNTKQLTLVFPNGRKLILGTFCSGCLENTCFI